MLATLLAALASFGVLAVVFIPLERVFPARPGQPLLRPAFRLDALFFFGQYLLWSALATSVLRFADVRLLAHVAVGLRAWMRAQPAWLHVAFALALGDLLMYWWHRACHHFDVLWRFHAVHHSSTHLDWLAAHREHPLDGVTTQLMMNLPALVLGVRFEVVASVAVLRGMWAIFVHSNVRLPLGPLRVLLGAPELHHFHHALTERTAHNFANLAPWLDILFGTYHCPPQDVAERYPLGVPGAPPRGYLAHILLPLLPSLRRRRG